MLHVQTNFHTGRYSICMHTLSKLLMRLRLPKENIYFFKPVPQHISLSINALSFMCVAINGSSIKPLNSLVNVTSGYVKENKSAM